MGNQNGKNYCDHCRRWLDGDTCRIDIETKRLFCSVWCAAQAGTQDTVEATIFKAPGEQAESESAPTQQSLAVPDIYLAELVGVIRRALQADGLTERLWAILDDWCDNQESYLEKKYPEAHEQAESVGAAAVDWLNSHWLNSRGPVFPGLDTFIRTGYAWDGDTAKGADESKSFTQEDYEAIKARTPGGVNSPELAKYREFVVEFMERGQIPEGAVLPSFLIPESPLVDDPDVAKNLAMRLGSYPSRRTYEVSKPTTPSPFAVSVDGVEIPELPSVSPEFAAYRKASDELMERMPNWFIPESPPFGKRDSALIDEMLKAGERFDYSLNDSGIKYTSIDGQRYVVAESDSACTCQAFQGDNQQCTLHGKGTAWHDLHGGE